MARTEPGKEYGYPGVIVRISTGKRPGRVLKVKHPIFGWIGPKVHYFIGKLESLFDRIDSLDAIAFTGLTWFYYKAPEEINKVIQATQTSIGIPAPSLLQPWEIGGIVIDFNIFGLLGGGLLGGLLLGAEAEALDEALKSLGNIPSRLVWAAVAAALTIIVGKAVIR